MPDNVSTALARKQEQERHQAGELGRYLASLQSQIARAAPKGLDPDRITRLALTAARKNPKLLQVIPESFAGALLTSTALGLEPEVGGESYLVPYGRECQLIVGYQGLTKLFYQHPLAMDVSAETVCEGDFFDWALGTQKYVKHRPAPAAERGKPTHYYAVATLRSGATPFVVLTADEVKDLRGGKVGPDPKFKGGDPMRWMERKTALRQLFKSTPKSYSLEMALERDERQGTELYQELRKNPGALDGPTATPAQPAGEQTPRVVQPENGPAYVEGTGEVVDVEPVVGEFDVQDPPDYDPSQEPQGAGWGPVSP